MKKGLLIFVSAFTIITACSKSSNSPAPPAGCTDAPCMLRAHNWKIFKSILVTDLGNYTHTAAEMAGLSWSSFSFKSDLTFTFFNGEGTYTLGSNNTQILAQFPTYSNVIHFDFTATSDGLTLKQLTVKLHPQTDFSDEANGIAHAYLQTLHDDFGVDTSTVHSIQAVFSYIIQ